MSIFDSSRYVANRLALVTDPNGVARVTILRPEPFNWSFRYSQYVWSVDDRIDLLTSGVYGDPNLWWIIARANPEIMDWSEVAPGTVLRIPDGINQ
jgi:hypothetical protein